MIEEFEIAKLRLQAGDVLVVRMAPITHETADAVRESLRPILPAGIKVLIIDNNTELSVLTQAEIEARSV